MSFHTDKIATLLLFFAVKAFFVFSEVLYQIRNIKRKIVSSFCKTNMRNYN